jgi:hypothetical protein
MVEPPWFDRDCFVESYPTYQRLNHSGESYFGQEWVFEAKDCDLRGEAAVGVEDL